MLFWIVLVPFLAAPAGLLVRWLPQRVLAVVLSSVPLLLFLFFASHIPDMVEGQTIIEVSPWVESLGVSAAFLLDGVSLVFGLIICGVGTLVVFYSGAFLSSANEQRRGGLFFFAVLVAIGAMLGVVLAEQVVMLAVFWQLSIVPLFLLIGFRYEQPNARRGAYQSLIVLMVASGALLAGLLLLAEAARRSGTPMNETASLQAILAVGNRITMTSLYPPILVLVFVGCFAYAALLPFSFWLPPAMAAPTPASTLLCCAMLPATGLYLLARLAPVLGESAFWSITLVLIGAATMLVGAVLTFSQSDPRKLLAWHTISWNGMLATAIGLGGSQGATGFAAGVLAHTLSSGSLFLAVGIAESRSWPLDLRPPAENVNARERAALPVTTTLATLAALSLAGVPGVFGFVARDALFGAGIAAITSERPVLPPTIGYLTLGSMVLSGGLTIGYAWRLLRFFRVGADRPAQQGPEAPPGMIVPTGLLAGLSLVLSLGVLSSVRRLLRPAVATMTGTGAGGGAGAEQAVSLTLWDGFDPALMLSMMVFAIGFMMAFSEQQIASMRWPFFSRFQTDVLMGSITRHFRRNAAVLSRFLQGGRLRTYIATILIMWPGIAGTIFLQRGLQEIHLPPAQVLWDDMLAHQHILLAALLMPVGIVLMLRARSRLEAMISIGIVGAMMALFFALSGAPDLALLQLLVEILLAVVFVKVFSILPARFQVYSRYSIRVRDALIGIGVGVVMAGLSLAVAARQFVAGPAPSPPPASPADQHTAAMLEKGRAVVQTILGDVRSFDTVGQMVILFLALLSVFSLLRLRCK